MVACVLSNIDKMAYFYATCTVGVTIYSTGWEIPPGFEFYIVTRSYSSCPFLSALALPDTFDDYSQPRPYPVLTHVV